MRIYWTSTYLRRKHADSRYTRRYYNVHAEYKSGKESVRRQYRKLRELGLSPSEARYSIVSMLGIANRIYCTEGRD
jgi:hypothetical protein